MHTQVGGAPWALPSSRALPLHGVPALTGGVAGPDAGRARLPSWRLARGRVGGVGSGCRISSLERPPRWSDRSRHGRPLHEDGDTVGASPRWPRRGWPMPPCTDTSDIGAAGWPSTPPAASTHRSSTEPPTRRELLWPLPQPLLSAPAPFLTLHCFICHIVGPQHLPCLVLSTPSLLPHPSIAMTSAPSVNLATIPHLYASTCQINPPPYYNKDAGAKHGMSYIRLGTRPRRTATDAVRRSSAWRCRSCCRSRATRARTCSSPPSTCPAASSSTSRRSTPCNAALSLKALFAALEGSLQRLQMDYVDLFIIHRYGVFLSSWLSQHIQKSLRPQPSCMCTMSRKAEGAGMETHTVK